MSIVAATMASSAALIPKSGDEARVDLQLVERKLPKVRERRAPGAEVVDGEAHAEILERPQGSARCVEIGEQGDLGDLEAQPRRVQLVLLEAPPDERRVVGALAGCGPRC